MRFLCHIVIVLGLVVSSYLLHRHLSLESASSGTDICSAVFGSSCDETLRSPYSVILGIPLAGWGVVYFGTMLATIFLGWLIGSTFQLEANLTALVLAITSATACLFFATMMVTGKVPFCPLCVVVQVACFLLVPLVKRRCRQPIGQIVVTMKNGLGYLVGRSTTNPQESQWKMIGILVVGLVSVVLYQWVLIQSNSHRTPDERPFSPSEAIADFESVPIKDIPITDDDPQRGPKDAKVLLVVFSDFQCPACRRFAAKMSNLTERFDDQLRIAFKHFPLGTACNDAVNRNLHPRACELAWAAEAAQNQDLFWEFHDAVFASKLDQQTTSQLVKQSLNIDIEQFEEDRRSDQVRANVAVDVEAGMGLGIDGTPSFFLNGRRIYDTRTEALEFLVAHAIKNADD